MKNFGIIKESLNQLLSNGLRDKNKVVKIAFGEYLKEVKSNKVLSTQFLLYKNIEDKKCDHMAEAYDYINASMSKLSSFSENEIKESNDNLYNKFSSIVDSNLTTPLYESIATLIENSHKIKDVNALTEAKKVIANHMLNNIVKDNVIKETVLPNSILYSIFSEKVNKKYENINEGEIEMVNKIMNTSKGEKPALFSEIIKETIELVNNKLETSDLTIKEGLLNVKENLLNRTFNSDTFIKDVVKIMKLKESLN